MKKLTWLMAAAALTGCGGDKSGTTMALPGTDTAAAPEPISNAGAQTGTVGCQSLSSRNPWGMASARTWTPRAAAESDAPLQSPGIAFGAAFSARLVEAYSEDYGEARQTVVLELANGCRRQFRAESFVDADRSVINAAQSAHPSATDAASYPIVYRSGFTSPEMVNNGSLGVATTQHFAVWYGKNTEGSFYKSIAQQGRSIEQVASETGEWLEKVWRTNRDVLNAPMPFANAPASDKRKLDIFLCGTGRPNPQNDDTQECGANAAEVMNVSAWAVPKGANTLAHEFGHMIQYYTGGFRDKSDAGMIWETGAEWNAFIINPIFANSAANYLNQLENGFLFSPARYGANPIMTYLFEKDTTRNLVFGAWQRNLRNAQGATQEDYLQAFVRLGKESGVYPNGFQSFADDAGWYGARLAAMDFLNQRTMLDQLRPTRTTTWLAHFYTPLATTSDTQMFASPPERPLLQWGTHIVPLESSSQTVKATLTGGTTANQAAWRFTIVAVAADGTPTYAPMTAVAGAASASVTMTPPANTKLYLVVTATPYTYETLGWQINGQAVNGTQFPYRVQITGATPRTGSTAACDPTAQQGAWTLNYRLSGNDERGRPCK
jgi:hypothetical protein